MKCSYCGEETKSGKVCGKCGKEIAPSGGMEIQYKDFRVSELLDIRMTSRFPSEESTEKSRPEAADVRPGKSLRTEEKPSAGKSFFVVTAIVVTFAAIVVFYLLRFLLRL